MRSAALTATASFWDMPWHPALVHFPIAFLFTASVLVIARHATGRAALERHIAPLLVVGTATLPFVVLTGVRDAGWFGIFGEFELGEPLLWHVLAALATITSAAGHLVTRVRRRESLTPRTDLAFATSTAWLLLLTGLLAAEVVYA
ncbi:MAG: DUF2231 domain-containing protein [Ilumatobacteraceae bacterium]